MQSNRITVTYGDDAFAMTKKLLEAENIKSVVPLNARIRLKPNLVNSNSAASGATTHVEIAEAVIEYFQSNGYKDIAIIEGAWVGAATPHAFKACGYEAAAKKYGVGLIDLQKDSFKELSYQGASVQICSQALDADFLIDLPVLKAHCQTGLTCALKNLKGCIPNSEKRRFHAMGLHRPIALLGKLLPVHLVIVDGLNGDLSFEEGGNPVKMNRMFMGTDPVLIDTYCANLIGFDKSEIDYIGYAEKLGVGSTDLAHADIVELNSPSKTDTKHIVSRRSQSLAKYIDERSACSACYASLINALDKLETGGDLRHLRDKFCIGQGFVQISGGGIGCGRCTAKLDMHIPGCPVKAIDIVEFVRGK